MPTIQWLFIPLVAAAVQFGHLGAALVCLDECSSNGDVLLGVNGIRLIKLVPKCRLPGWTDPNCALVLTKLIPLGLKRLKRWWSAKHLSAPPICCNLIDVMVCFVEVNAVFSNAKMPGPSACVPRGPVWEPCDAWLMCPVLNNLNDAYISLPVRLVISNMNMVKTAKQHRSVAVCQTDWRCGTNV